MACSCSTFTVPSFSCDAQVPGISSVKISGGSAIPCIETTSTYNTVMTYNKQTNSAVWETTVTINFGFVKSDQYAFAFNFTCVAGRTLVVTLNNGSTITIPAAVLGSFTANPGAPDGSNVASTLVLVAKSGTKPTYA